MREKDEVNKTLGLLYFVKNEPQLAASTWEPLDALGGEHPLYKLKEAIAVASDGRLSKAISMMEAALPSLGTMPALANDMAKLKEEWQQGITENSETAVSAESESDKDTIAQHYFLSTYQKH